MNISINVKASILARALAPAQIITCVLNGLFLLPTSADDLHTAPLDYIDTHSLELGVGTPVRTVPQRWLNQQWQWRSSVDYANTAHLESNNREELVLDIESERRALELSYGWELRNHQKLLMGLNVAHWRHSAGHWDGFIDEFHQALGFPEGARPFFERNAFAARYTVNGVVVIDEANSDKLSPRESWGLARLFTHYQWLNRQAWSASAGVQLSTPLSHNPRALFGMASTDISAWLSAQHHFAQTWEQHGALGIAQQIKSIGERANTRHETIGFGQYGLAWRVNRYIELNTQAHYQGAVLDSQLVSLGDTYAVVLGGRVYLPQRWNIEISVTEDILPLSAPDVVFHLGVSKTFGGL